MSSTYYEVETKDGITHLQFARPDQSNALNAEFWTGFAQVIADISNAGETRVMVVSGQGKNFCAGLDLATLGSGMPQANTPEQREAFPYLVQIMQDAISAVEKARFPVIAAVQGACLGAGLDFLSACDLCVVAEDAYFRIEEINIGMMADVGSLQRLPNLLPERVVREMAYLGRTMDAQEAHELSFATDICADKDAAVARAMELAAQIAAKATVAIAGSKRAINYSRDHAVDDSLQWAAMSQAAYWNPPDYMRAIQARMTKQPADFPAPAPVHGLKKS